MASSDSSVDYYEDMDAYQVLGVERTTSAKEIKAAYRKGEAPITYDVSHMTYHI
jgi:DnaJ-domain-containing protein 1